MALVEQPVDIVATRNGGMGGPFVLGNHALRSSWVNSFYIPPDAKVSYLFNFYAPYPPFVGYGAVLDHNGKLTDQVAGYNLTGGPVGNFMQLYVAEASPAGGATIFSAWTSSLSPTFPVGSLPLAVLVLDGVERIQQAIDFRPSNLSSAPSFGGGTESISDPTKRVYFQNNYTVPRTYALSAQIPADVALPSPGFFLGSGAVVISGNTISTPTIYLSSSPKSNSLGLQLAANSINQGYVDGNTGQVTIRQVQTSGTFPANSLALFEATTGLCFIDPEPSGFSAKLHLIGLRSMRIHVCLRLRNAGTGTWREHITYGTMRERKPFTGCT